tara:strand:+ start:29 stop:517 length:489 start_codon:yes stop_codon:yes gene_type:complete
MADLTVTLTEAVTLNGAARGSTNTLTVAGVDDVYHRIITVPSGVPVSVAVFKSTTGIGLESAMDVENVKYIRVTNLESSNSVILDLQIDTAEDDSAAADNAALLLEAGKSFIMGSPSDGIFVNDGGATPVTALSSLINLESIIIDPLAAACKIEVFIASVVA